MATVGVEGDDEPGSSAATTCRKPARSAAPGMRPGRRDHLEGQTEAFRLRRAHGSSPVGRVVVDEQHGQLDAGAARVPSPPRPLGQDRSDRRRLVVGPHHDSATHADQPRVAAMAGTVPSDREAGPVRPGRRMMRDELSAPARAPGRCSAPTTCGGRLTRMAHEILERNRGLDGVVLLGLQRGGVWLAERLGAEIARIDGRCRSEHRRLAVPRRHRAAPGRRRRDAATSP